MKKTGVLNSEISAVIAAMGHMDLLAIVDCGYPVPYGIKKIDLVLRYGNPGILETLAEISKELAVEKVIIASESQAYCQELICNAVAFFPDAQSEAIPHLEFKQLVKTTVAVIRTGECIKYSNVILQSGVVF
jgi:D-ribose pyranase